MLSKSLKRKIAVLLTGAMVFGMTLTAWADPVSGTAVESQGTGNFEGHVNRKVVDVTLPTVSENTSPFSFIYDAEGLIPETHAAAYGSGYTFPNTTHVYFKTADKKFGADSTEFTVSNNSSVSVNIALKIEMEKDANAPELVGKAEDVPADYEEGVTASSDPKLYLGLVVGGDATGKVETQATGTYAVSENTVEKTFNIEGVPGNYSVSTNEVGEEAGYPHTYEFKKKTTGLAPWKKITFKLTGKANKVDNAEGKTAPNLKVTWNFAALDEDAIAVGGGSSSGGTTSNTKTGEMEATKIGQTWYVVVKGESGAAFEENKLTALAINEKDLTSDALFYQGMYGVSLTTLTAKSVDASSGKTLTATYTVDGVKYEASYTVP